MNYEPQKVPSLDGLRGFAFLLVLVSHFSNHYDLPLKGVGKAGVWIFFVLSAFLLTRQMLAHTYPLSRENLAMFFRRRALRIAPPYFAALTIFLAANYLISINNILGHFLFINGVGHFWTVAVEVQFYLLLPLFAAGILWMNRHGPRLAFAMLLSVWTLSFVIFPPSWFKISETHVLPYLGVFLAGCMIAQLEALKVRLTTQAASLVFVCAAAVLLLTTPSIWSAVVEPVETTHFYRDYPLFAVVGAALVLSCLSPGSAAARLFASSPMRLLGRVSFSGYLMHPLALHLTSHLAATIGKLPSMLVSALTVAALTVALYYAAERPLISLKKAAAA